MHISWLGSSTIKLQTKPFDQDITVVIDPYRPEKGEFPRSLTPHIALFTHGEEDAITLSGAPFVLSHPGECETKGVLITGIQGHAAGQTFFRIDAENLSIGHLGRITEPLTDAQMEILSEVDILFVPVGGDNAADAELAAKIANSIEPRIIIPMAYKSDIEPKAAPIDLFLKEIGGSTEKEEKKVIIKKKDLPIEETKIIVISKE